MVITVQCSSCSSSFPVDPDKVPEGGVHARCSECSAVFFVEKPQAGAAPGPAPDAGMGGGAAGAGDADEWVFETETEVDPSEVEVEPLATVEEGTRRAMEDTEVGGGEEFAGGFDAGGGYPDETALGVDEPAPGPAGPAPGIGGGDGGDAGATEDAAPAAFSFGRRDPHEKAQRLARVLVSDMVMYNPERHSRALEEGTLKDDFEEEIKKSWEEYVEQVGTEIADATDYFNEALNDILARGRQVFP